MSTIFHLIRCVWYLGFKSGLYFWKLNNKAAKEPEMMLKWANNCESEFPEFAKMLRESYVAYKNVKKI